MWNNTLRILKIFNKVWLVGRLTTEKSHQKAILFKYVLYATGSRRGVARVTGHPLVQQQRARGALARHAATRRAAAARHARAARACRARRGHGRSHQTVLTAHYAPIILYSIIVQTITYIVYAI